MLGGLVQRAHRVAPCRESRKVNRRYNVPRNRDTNKIKEIYKPSMLSESYVLPSLEHCSNIANAIAQCDGLAGKEVLPRPHGPWNSRMQIKTFCSKQIKRDDALGTVSGASKHNGQISSAQPPQRSPVTGMVQT